MVRTFRRWLLAVAALVLAVRPGFAQTTDGPHSLGSGSVSSAWQISGSAPAGAADLHSGEDRNDSVLVGSGLDGPHNNLGWFATVDLDLLSAHVHDKLNSTVGVGGTAEHVSLPGANLDWNLSPRFEVGYRLGQGAGELLLSYRFLSTSGSGTTPAFDSAGNPGQLRSRLSMNVIDMDYASQEPSLQPWVDMKWRVGIRLAGLYFDSEEASPLLQQHVTNYFFGAGPHAALELWRPVTDTNFGFFGKLDLAGVLGKVQQGFEETIPGPTSGFTRQTQFMPSTMLNVQLGVGWTPRENWRISAGYTYEHWWDAAYSTASNGTVSTGDVWTQGFFFRSEWKY